METQNDFSSLASLDAESPQSSVATSLICNGEGLEEGRSHEILGLVRRAQSGDGAALEALFGRFRARAMAVALKVLRNRDDAEDAVQDAFVKIWRNLHRFEGRSSFSTWIHRIVMNASLDLLRRQTSRGEGASGLADHDEDRAPQREAVDETTPECTLASAEAQVLVRLAVARLTPVHREALTLREFEENSYDEIARAVACPIGTVMSRLHHARQRVAAELRAMVPDEFELCAA